MKSNWWVDKELESVFPNLDTISALNGEEISRSPLSRVIKFHSKGKNYYVKIYHRAGRHLRQWFGRSRIRAEWENLLLFESLGIKIPKIIAFGEEKNRGQFCGALITEELVDYIDMKKFATIFADKLKTYHWCTEVIRQIADCTLRLHRVNFIHNDLKWRNILMNNDGEPVVYFIDCPVGRRRVGFQFKRGVIKDLACLDKYAKWHLSRTFRLRFFCMYHQIKKITPAHKNKIRKILKFYQGRE